MEDSSISRSRSLVIVSVVSITVAASYFVLTIKGQNKVLRPFDRNVSKHPHILNKTAEQKYQYIAGLMFQRPRNTTEEAENNNKGSKRLHFTENILSKSKERCHKRLPQAIIAGHLKSGTAALKIFLNEHPQISSCLEGGDVKFFDRYYLSRGLNWYRSVMPCTFDNEITIEKTAQYFLSKRASVRIHDMSPETKIILILKDPVKVAVSLYAMWREHERNSAHEYSFERMVTTLNGTTLQINPNAKIIQLCSYAGPMQRWIHLFNRTQLLILDGNTFDRHPEEGLVKVEQFLNVKHFFRKKQFVYNFTKGKYCFRRANKMVLCLPEGKGRPHPPISVELEQMLTEYFKPINQMFFEIINQTFSW